METKSLIVGVLIGACICLGAMIVLGQGVETAVAATPTFQAGRYQLSMDGQPYVLDCMTGAVYCAKSVRGGYKWFRVIDGPPRVEP